MENIEFTEDALDAAVCTICKRKQTIQQLMDMHRRFNIVSPISGDHLNRATITG